MNLEGDALGSELATYLLLRKLHKKVVICNNDVTPKIYSFLPSVEVIKNELEDDSFDVALVLDCSDSSRTGKVKDYLSRAKCIVNIDHHVSNTYFGDLNWVQPNVSSAAEMVYQLCRRLNIIDKNIALCIFTGIFTDTGNFTYSNTNARVYRIVSHLMKYEIYPDKIYRALHSGCSINNLKFMGRILTSLKTDKTKKICWASVEKWPESDFDLTEIVFSMMRLFKEGEVFVLFKKMGKSKIRINFRSNGKVDVNRIAKFFGGGGHKCASGTTLEDTLEGAERKVINFIKRYTNEKNRK